MSRTKKQVMTDPILKKGHVHEEDRFIPEVCFICGGTGILITYDSDFREHDTVCWKCDGLGEI